jgi:TolB-like protein/tetratricopeptide (TPR) repeat protein
LADVRLGSRTLQPRRQLLADGQRLPIGRRALEIISVLAEARGEIVTKSEILDAVWPGLTVEENALQVHVVALRKALGPEAGKLETVWGIGYKLSLEADDLECHDDKGKTSLAVVENRSPLLLIMPFVNRSGDTQQDYFADGVTDDVIIELSKVTGLGVIARSSAFAVEGHQFGTRELVRQLQVSHILEGSVRKAGDRIRVTAQLIDATTNDQLWAERYDRNFGDVFELQGELSKAIVEALQLELAPADIEPRAAPTINSVAYDHYMHARALRASLNLPEDLFRSIDAYRRALALDPRFAMAWAGLASALSRSTIHMGEVTEAHRLETESALSRALELGSHLTEVIATRSYCALQNYDWPEVERCIDDWRQRQDSKWTVFSNLLLAVGRANEASDQQLLVRRSDPLSLGVSYAVQWTLDCAGRLEGAEAEYANSKELLGDRGRVEWRAATRMLAIGDVARAQERLVTAVANGHQLPRFAPPIFAALTQPRQAIEMLAAAIDDSAFQDPVHMTGLAHLAAYFGDSTLALAAFRRALVETSNIMIVEIWHPLVASLRREPGFKQLLEDLGLADYWRQTGAWGDFARPLGAGEFEIIA